MYSAMYFVPSVHQTTAWIPLNNQNTTNIDDVMVKTSSKTLMQQSIVTLTPTVHTTSKPAGNSVLTFWIMLSLLIVFQLFTGQFFTIIDAATQKLVKQHGAEFGRQRLWGGVAWGIWSPIAGLAIDSYQSTSTLRNQYTPIFIMFGALSLLCIIPTFLIKLPSHEQPQSISRNILSVLLQPIFLMFLLAIFICGTMLGILNTFLFIFLQDELDSPHYLMGLTLTVTCISEVPVMFFAKKMISLLGYMKSMNLVLITWGLRSFLYSILQSAFWVLPIELLHGITFGLFYTAFTEFVNWISPEGVQTSVQAFSTGIFMGVGKWV